MVMGCDQFGAKSPFRIGGALREARSLGFHIFVDLGDVSELSSSIQLKVHSIDTNRH